MSCKAALPVICMQSACTKMLLHVQVSKNKYDVGYLEKARLGQIWQPWYADLMQQARLSGLACCSAVV